VIIAADYVDVLMAGSSSFELNRAVNSNL